MTKVEIKNSDLDFKDFKPVFVISKIEIDKVTFVKHEISQPSKSLMDSEKSVIEVGRAIGEEIHACKPEVIGEIAGQVGLVIKGFEVKVIGKKKKKVIVDKIIRL